MYFGSSGSYIHAYRAYAMPVAVAETISGRRNLYGRVRYASMFYAGGVFIAPPASGGLRIGIGSKIS